MRTNRKRSISNGGRESVVDISRFAGVIRLGEDPLEYQARLRGEDLDALHQRVTAFMRRSRPGREPCPQNVARAIRGHD